LKDALGNIQTDGANLFHGRLLRVMLNTSLWHNRCRQGVSTPSPAANIGSGKSAVRFSASDNNALLPVAIENLRLSKV
jgi:hypothetical protein